MRVPLFQVALGCLSFLPLLPAQCGHNGPPPPPPPAPAGGWMPDANSGNPTTPEPASPSAPQPAGPAAPAAPGPEQPKAGPTTPRSPMPTVRAAGRTGGAVMSFERGHTSKQRLKVDWLHPVPPTRRTDTTSAVGPLPLGEVLDTLWGTDDDRPLLVLRECNACKDGDDALLARALDNDRTLLLSKWFRTVRLPAHVLDAHHPLARAFYGLPFPEGTPHFYLLAHRGAKPVAFTGKQTQAQLWKGMNDVLEQRYAKDPAKTVKQWLSLLDQFDVLDARRTRLQEELAESRATEGPQGARSKKLADSLASTVRELDEALTSEARLRDLGLLPAPKPLAAK